MKEMRREERFEDFGRVDSDSLCIVSGILDDVSLTGCKVSYSVPPKVDMEKEYEIKVRLSRMNSDTICLLVLPVWISCENGKSSVGFSILQSKDYAKWLKYISVLEEDKSDFNEYLPKDDDSSLFV